MASPNQKPTHEHCTHGTGAGSIANGVGGSYEVVCCVCGCKGTQRFEMQGHTLIGHGPHYQHSTRILKEIRWYPEYLGTTHEDE